MTTLFTQEYADLLAEEHSTGEWGRTAQQYIEPITKYAAEVNETHMLDYGAGRGGLKMHIPEGYTITEYEPGRPDTRDNNTPHNYVVCIDVLEHIEPDCIDAVLDDLQRVTLKGGFFTVSTRLAGKILKDGRNAHLIVKPFEWWAEQLGERFEIAYSYNDYSRQRGEFFVKRKA